ncbi:histidine--tRNA ligase [Tardiphaga sp. 71_E8_N1_1]|jgi:histidyl-tRNA synthetase|uniref:histidine--tRNA ligase n=1 Tax=Tardiphaga sp. 71_E8_N1_1 TaxID=3240784 RepID=UPI003F8A58FB
MTDISKKSDKPKKPQKLRPRLPRGLGDRGPADIAATRRMTDTIREVYELYGFEPVETPTMEFTDALGKFLPDQDRPNEGVFSFQDDDEQWISLRYDLTAPLARYVAENFDHLPKPYRSYRAGYVYRNEKPGPGRFRQFMQFDADTVGSGSPAADAEMCMMAAEAMEALGLGGHYVVKVNNRKVLDGVMESIGIGGDEKAGQRLTVLRAIDKLDKFPVEEIVKLLGKGRWDGDHEGKGDFTKGADLNALQIEFLLNFLRPVYGYDLQSDFERPFADMEPIAASNGNEVAPRFIDNYGTLNHWTSVVGLNETAMAGIQELRQMVEFCESAGYGSKRIKVDSSVIRGLEYYTGPVFEVELTLEIEDEKGNPVRFGSVGGGGRYDGLVSRFRGQPVPATGFSIGVSRLQAALDQLSTVDSRPRFGPVVVTVFGGPIAHYQKFVSSLRRSGIHAELYLGNPKNNLGVQFKYADRRNSPCAIVQGSEEHNRGEVVIKDLIAGRESALFHEAVGTSREQYLEERSAQFAVPEYEMVQAVESILRRYQVNRSMLVQPTSKGSEPDLW